MQQNAKFIRKLPIPMDIKKEFPVTEEVAKVREARVEEMRAILDGRDSRLMLIIGPLLCRPRGQRDGLCLPPRPPAGKGQG